MPYIFFTHAGEFFKLVSSALGDDVWPKKKLVEFAMQCGYTILESVNASLKEYTHGGFCPEYVQGYTVDTETLTLSSSNHAGKAEWHCISKEASCDDGSEKYIFIALGSLAGLVCLSFCLLASYYQISRFLRGRRNASAHHNNAQIPLITNGIFAPHYGAIQIGMTEATPEPNYVTVLMPAEASP